MANVSICNIRDPNPRLTVTDRDIQNPPEGRLDLPLLTAPVLPAGLLGNIPIYPKCVASGTRHLLTGGANIMSPRHARRGVAHEHFHEVPGHVQLHLADGSPRVAEVRP